tara:strand:+ start:322 stop:531 length:210 start_codon:yes stop_codon:yes gene_type:complete
MKKSNDALPGSDNVLDQINGPANRYLPSWIAREGTDIPKLNKGEVQRARKNNNGTRNKKKRQERGTESA